MTDYPTAFSKYIEHEWENGAKIRFFKHHDSKYVAIKCCGEISNTPLIFEIHTLREILRIADDTNLVQLANLDDWDEAIADWKEAKQ